jgi:hypothetical protein
MQTIDIKTNNFRGEKQISVYKAIVILAKNNIHVNEDEAAEILNFLYHVAKMYSNTKTTDTLRKHRILKKLTEDV